MWLFCHHRPLMQKLVTKAPPQLHLLMRLTFIAVNATIAQARKNTRIGSAHESASGGVYSTNAGGGLDMVWNGQVHTWGGYVDATARRYSWVTLVCSSAWAPSTLAAFVATPGASMSGAVSPSSLDGTLSLVGERA
jgi:hypothetical protein